jgi:hypothetical protein
MGWLSVRIKKKPNMPTLNHNTHEMGFKMRKSKSKRWDQGKSHQVCSKSTSSQVLALSTISPWQCRKIYALRTREKLWGIIDAIDVRLVTESQENKKRCLDAKISRKR